MLSRLKENTNLSDVDKHQNLDDYIVLDSFFKIKISFTNLVAMPLVIEVPRLVSKEHHRCVKPNL